MNHSHTGTGGTGLTGASILIQHSTPEFEYQHLVQTLSEQAKTSEDEDKDALIRAHKLVHDGLLLAKATAKVLYGSNNETERIMDVYYRVQEHLERERRSHKDLTQLFKQLEDEGYQVIPPEDD